MADDKYCWHPLDGSWHGSVATRSSALHLKANSKPHAGAMCNPLNTALLEDGYTFSEGEREGRLCKRCLKAAGIKLPAHHDIHGGSK